MGDGSGAGRGVGRYGLYDLEAGLHVRRPQPGPVFPRLRHRSFRRVRGRRMLEPSPVFTRGFLYTAMGVGIASLLMVVRARFTRWPLHPVALPISTIWFTDVFFFSVFLAWAIKAVVLKFGGAAFYRRTRPFFIRDRPGGNGVRGWVERCGLFYRYDRECDLS